MRTSPNHGAAAFAANHYLITKTSQIKPSVLHTLR
jgi:hypothetical protein